MLNGDKWAVSNVAKSTPFATQPVAGSILEIGSCWEKLVSRDRLVPVLRRIGYRPLMRPLWPIEREVLEITAAEYSGSVEAMRRQIDTAQVTSFENSGAGFFSDLAVADDTPVLFEKSPLSGAYGSVLGIEHGMGFIVFLKDGRLSMIEGYCNAGGPTTDIDFSRAVYGLMPWRPKPDPEA